MKVNANNSGAEVSTYRNYKKIFRISIILTSFVAIAPLIFLTILNYIQYQKTYQTDVVNHLARQLSIQKNGLEAFIHERISVLKFIAQSYSTEDLLSREKLYWIFLSLRNSFGGFVDIGIIDSSGTQINYIGPHGLLYKNYSQQGWFPKVWVNLVDVSEVSMGFRGIPHFSITILKYSETQKNLIIRASINSEVLAEQFQNVETPLPSNVFLTNYNGVLQTDSKQFGKNLSDMGIEIPTPSKRTQIIQTRNSKNERIWLAYSYIESTPFILIEITKAETLMANWTSKRNQLFTLLIVSIAIIIFVILRGSSRFIKILKENDFKIAQIMHEIEYTNKIASIGRLAAGVAHEINNPLSIINENAGLIQDLLVSSPEFPQKKKILNSIHSIFNNIQRCSKITHQLLGFAKKMEPNLEQINLSELFIEVVGFVNKLAFLKNIQILINKPQEEIIITSDKSLLQQVFINILNNSIEAIDGNGKIEISFSKISNDFLEIKVSDNGRGIPEKELPHIFEPFFSTKKEYGTGLGLSITYGIIQKLSGKIYVESQENVGTTFSIHLPINTSLTRVS